MDYLEAPEPEEQLLGDSTSVTNLQLVNVAFQESNKWRFTDGTTSFYEAVRDDGFIRRVQNNSASFSKEEL